MKNSSPVVVALDYADAQSALNLATQLSPQLCKLKIGKELFTAAGPQLVEKLQTQGFDIFLDLKFHDIPNTVAKACEVAARLGVWMLNVHASGGKKMLLAAKEGVDKSGQSPFLIAVTILTSMQQADLAEIGIQTPVESQVLKLAELTQTAGLHGVVCSANEATLLRGHLPKDFMLVTPGIRPASAAIDDQARVMTPAQATLAGVNYMVIGRPITQAANPLASLQQILAEIG